CSMLLSMVASFGGAGTAPPTSRRPPQRFRWQGLAFQPSNPAAKRLRSTEVSTVTTDVSTATTDISVTTTGISTAATDISATGIDVSTDGTDVSTTRPPPGPSGSAVPRVTVRRAPWHHRGMAWLRTID